ncbi:hypothetical protein JCM3765_000291 [Sporobolomyces pararoseus]
MELCVACSATLDSGSIPSTSEKPSLPIYFECNHVLCGNCARRKSLTTACILCHSANDILSTSGSNPSSSNKRSTPSRSEPPKYTDEEAAGFVLGEDSEDEEEEEYASPPSISPSEELPPAYQEGETLSELKNNDNGKREQCNIHYIKPDETLVGLSLKYGVEGPLLCQMNRLPISTLSTTPHLVHTLPFLLLPPHAAPSTSTTPLLPPAEERRRLIIRRFQVQTRCADYNVAKCYIDQIFEKRKEEARFVRMNREASGSETDETETLVREGGELEEAVNAFLADERWEKEQKENAKGKGKGLFGSKMRSTGQMDSVGKRGWSWH